MTKAAFVAISDIHFNIKTYRLAAAALEQALSTAEQLNVPLLINGDLNDTKAMLRAECVSTIINILADAKVPVFVNVGNHDLINHHDSEHSLEFLRPYVTLIQAPVYVEELKAVVIPYQHDAEKLKQFLDTLKTGKKISNLLLMHQGFLGAAMGEYVVDKTSIDPEEVKDFRVISGHYHKHQDVGTVTYIGSPYTITFAEANDGPKGFIVVNEHGGVQQVQTKLRKHVIIDRELEELANPIAGFEKDDLLWLRVRGPSIELDKLKKKDIGANLVGHQNFKLDKISTDVPAELIDVTKMTREQIIDLMIDRENVDPTRKNFLKALWRDILK